MRAQSKQSSSWFTRFAKVTSRAAGNSAAFWIALLVVLAWGISGPLFDFSDTWQLVINTGTTIATFLMVFLIQNTQNRDAEALQIKLDELIRSIDGAHLALLDLEEMEQQDLDRICNDYRQLAKQARKDLQQGKSDTDVREVGVQYRESSDARSTRKPKQR